MALMPSELDQTPVMGTVQTPVEGVKYVRCGQLVTVTVDKEITTASSTWVEVCSGLPRPAIEVYGVARPNSITDTRMILMDINVVGRLQVTGAGATNALIRGSITYITKD